MFSAQRNKLREQPCPEFAERGKCRTPGCIYSHPEVKPVAADASATSAGRGITGRSGAAGAAHERKRSAPMGIIPGRAAKIAKQGPPMARTVTGSSTKAVTLPRLAANFAPRILNASPVGYQYRAQMLKAVRARMEKRGIANAAELAMDQELETARRSTAATYAQEIRNVVRAIDRGDLDAGAAERREAEAAAAKSRQLRAGLERLVIPLDKLAERYITALPTPATLVETVRRPCERCKAETSIAEIRRLAAEPDSVRRCTFHPLRRQWDPKTRKLADFYPCCGHNMSETNGCETRSTHVFKLADPTELAAMVPFRVVPASKGASEGNIPVATPIAQLGAHAVGTPETASPLFAIAVDCEMAYTTKGMELIRVSALDWDTSRVVLDRLVYPSGQVIDLNTRWSGVADIEAGTDVDGVHLPTVTFEDAIAELLSLVNDRTVLVGHGLENDLNTMRLVHHRVVDTAMLYPPVRSRTFALRQLAWMYLSKEIQTGEHDSFEDALVSMDIVKRNILKPI